MTARLEIILEIINATSIEEALKNQSQRQLNETDPIRIIDILTSLCYAAMADCGHNEAATDEFLRTGFIVGVEYLAQPENHDVMVETLATLGIDSIAPVSARLARCQARRSLLMS